MIDYETAKLRLAAERFRLRFAILHGSRAKNTAREDSDLDIAILGERPIDMDSFMEMHRSFSEIFKKYDLDFKTLHRVDPLFRHEVVNDGILLFGDSADYEDFKAFSHHAYIDAKPLFELEELLSRRHQKHLNALCNA